MKKLIRVGVLAAFVLVVAVAAACGGGDDEAGEAAGVSASVAFDEAFIDAMVPHHRSAIEMATTAKEAGLSQPDLVEIADNIIANQQAEIDRMLEWREQWYGSAELGPVNPSALGLSESQLGIMAHSAGDLEEAADVDQAFAEMMIAHHQGAITMASVAQDEAEHDELKELAGNIIAAQDAEIDIMQGHAQGGHT